MATFHEIDSLRFEHKTLMSLIVLSMFSAFFDQSINQSINQSFILTRYVKELKNSLKIRTCINKERYKERNGKGEKK